MMINSKKLIAMVLAFTLCVGSFAACSKKKSKSLSDSVHSYIDDTDAETYEIEDDDDLRDFVDDMEDITPDVLKQGVLFTIENDTICDMADEADYPREFKAFLDPEDITRITGFAAGEIDEDSLENLGVIALVLVEFEEEDAAVDVFEMIDLLGIPLKSQGLDLDDLSKDEYDYDKDSAEGHIILNLNIPQLIELYADVNGEDISDMKDAFEDRDIDFDDLSNVNIAIALKKNDIVIAFAYGDEYISDLDDIFSKSGFVKPSSVETSDDVIEFIEAVMEDLSDYNEKVEETSEYLDEED